MPAIKSTFWGFKQLTLKFVLYFVMIGKEGGKLSKRRPNKKAWKKLSVTGCNWSSRTWRNAKNRRKVLDLISTTNQPTRQSKSSKPDHLSKSWFAEFDKNSSLVTFLPTENKFKMIIWRTFWIHSSWAFYYIQLFPNQS